MSEQLPSFDDVRTSLLEALHYEGEQGIWEVVWTLNSSYPSAPQSAKVELAREVVFALVEEGRVRMGTAPWASALPQRTLTDGELAHLRSDAIPWSEPGEFIVWLSET